MAAARRQRRDASKQRIADSQTRQRPSTNGNRNPATDNRRSPAVAADNRLDGASRLQLHPADVRHQEMSQLLVRTVFSEAQQPHRHNQAVKQLAKIAKTMSPDAFYQELARNTQLVLNSDPKSPFPKNVMSFITQYLVTCCRPNVNSAENQSPNSGQSEELLRRLIDQLILPTLLNPKTDCRVNACHLLRKVFNEIDFDVEESVYESVKRALIERCTDRSAVVRVQAAMALHRFQDPDDDQDVALNALKFHLRNDPDAEMRQACLQVLMVRRDSYEELIHVTRDIKDFIRKIAFVKIADQVSFDDLSMDQKMRVLKNGVADRSSAVKKAFEVRLLGSWLSVADGNLLKLLEQSDILRYPELIEKILNVYFEQFLTETVTIDEDLSTTKFHVLVDDFTSSYLDRFHRITKKPLSIESAILWRVMMEFCKSKKVMVKKDEQKKQLEDGPVDDIEAIENQLCGQNVVEEGVEEVELIERLLPDLPHFCPYLKKFFDFVTINKAEENDSLEFEFIFHELMKLCLFIDIDDEAQKKILTFTIRTFLINNIGDDKLNNYINNMIKCLAQNVFTTSDLILDFTVEVISEIHLLACEEATNAGNDAMDVEDEGDRTEAVRYAKLNFDLNVLRDELDEAVANEEYLRAQAIKDSIDKVKTEMNGIKEKRFEPQTAQATQSDSAHLEKHPEAMLRCLHILASGLEHGNFTEVNSVMQTHIEKLCMPGITNEDERHRKVAIRCLGMVCFISPQYTRQYLAVLIQALKLDVESVKIVALQSIFDCFCQHGINILDMNKKLLDDGNPTVNQEEDEDFMTLLTRLFESQFDCASDEIKLVTAQGISKLLILGKMYSAHLLGKLILLWFKPSENTKLVQFIGDFLRIYAFAEAQGVIIGQNALEETFMDVLERIYRDDIDYVNFDSVIKFFLNLIVDESQGNLTLVFAKKIVALEPVDKKLAVGFLMPALAQLSLVEMEMKQLKTLEGLVEQIQDKYVKSKTLAKICGHLKARIEEKKQQIEADAAFEADFAPMDGDEATEQNQNEENLNEEDKPGGEESGQPNQNATTTNDVDVAESSQEVGDGDKADGSSKSGDNEVRRSLRKSRSVFRKSPKTKKTIEVEEIFDQSTKETSLKKRRTSKKPNDSVEEPDNEATVQVKSPIKKVNNVRKRSRRRISILKMKGGGDMIDVDDIFSKSGDDDEQKSQDNASVSSRGRIFECDSNASDPPNVGDIFV